MTLREFISLLADLAQIASGFLVVFIFIRKRKQIESALRFYSKQRAYEDISRLVANCLKDVEAERIDSKKTMGEISEIIGRLKGNKNLPSSFTEIQQKLANAIEDPKKINISIIRAVLGELQEMLRTDQTEMFDSNRGGSLE